MARPLWLLLCLPALVGCAGPAGLRATSHPAAAGLEEEAIRFEAVVELESGESLPLSADAVQYDLLLFGQPVAVGSVAVNGVVLPPGGRARLELPIRIPFADLPQAMVGRLRESRRIPAELRGRILLRKARQRRPTELPFRIETTLDGIRG